MNVAVIGAGMMGSVVAWDLARSNDVDAIVVGDVRQDRLAYVKKTLGYKVESRRINARFVQDEVRGIVRGSDVVVSALPHGMVNPVDVAAVEAGARMVNVAFEDEQMKLDRRAKHHGALLIPGCGVAPGLSNILVAQGMREVEAASEGHIYVGGLPQHPVPPLNYRLVFSMKGLLREYTMPARIISEGAVVSVAPFAEISRVRFPKPVGLLEAFFTDGLGSSIYSLRGLRSLDEKTLRWPGHAEKIKFLIDSGFMSEDAIRSGDAMISPIEVSSSILSKTLTKGDSPDMTVMRVETIGMEDGERGSVRFDLLDFYDELNDVTSMGRTTGFTAAIVARMVGRGELSGTGVRPPETALDPRLVEKLLSELSLKGVKIKKSRRRAGPIPKK